MSLGNVDRLKSTKIRHIVQYVGCEQRSIGSSLSVCTLLDTAAIFSSLYTRHSVIYILVADEV